MKHQQRIPRTGIGGRKRLGTQRNIVIPDDAWSALHRLATHHDTTRSALIRDAIDYYIALHARKER